MKRIVTDLVFALISCIAVAEDISVPVETPGVASSSSIDSRPTLTQAQYDAVEQSMDNSAFFNTMVVMGFAIKMIDPVTWGAAAVLKAAGQPTNVRNYSEEREYAKNLSLHRYRVIPNEPVAATGSPDVAPGAPEKATEAPAAQ